MTIGILDYKMGNIHTLYRKFFTLTTSCKVIQTPKDIDTCDKLILPGVGHFGQAMKNLEKLDFIDNLNESVLIKEKPVLGICLGMQLMAHHSEEGNVNGLGWIDVSVKKIQVNDKLRYKVPHTGWNTVNFNVNSCLSENIPHQSEFYFVHTYAVNEAPTENTLCTSIYEKQFVSGIQKNTIFGVQFHPEKSHQIGEQVLKNFIKL